MTNQPASDALSFLIRESLRLGYDAASDGLECPGDEFVGALICNFFQLSDGAPRINDLAGQIQTIRCQLGDLAGCAVEVSN